MLRTLQDHRLVVFLSDTHIGGDEGHDIFESPNELTALLDVRAQILHPCHLDAASRRLQQCGLTDAHIPRTRSAAPCSGNSVDEFVEPGQLTLAAEDGILGNVAVRGDGKRRYYDLDWRRWLRPRHQSEISFCTSPMPLMLWQHKKKKLKPRVGVI